MKYLATYSDGTMEEIQAVNDEEAKKLAVRRSFKHGALRELERIIFNRQGLVTLVPARVMNTTGRSKR